MLRVLGSTSRVPESQVSDFLIFTAKSGCGHPTGACAGKDPETPAKVVSMVGVVWTTIILQMSPPKTLG